MGAVLKCTMLARIVFCTALSLAVVTVVLLAVFSPGVQRKPSKTHTRPMLALSLYIQKAPIATHRQHPVSHSTASSGTAAAAFVFRRTLTKGPENTSEVVGQAQGFVLPVKRFEHSAFNIIYLTFDTPEYSGSLGVQAKHLGHKDRQELTVVGGTGSFAFAHGLAAFAETAGQSPQDDDANATYHINLQLQLSFPNS